MAVISLVFSARFPPRCKSALIRGLSRATLFFDGLQPSGLDRTSRILKVLAHDPRPYRGGLIAHKRPPGALFRAPRRAADPALPC